MREPVYTITINVCTSKHLQEMSFTTQEEVNRKKNWQAVWFVDSYILRKSTFFPPRTVMNAFLHSHMAMKKTDSGSNQCGCMCEGSVTCFWILDIKGKVNIQHNTGRLTFLHKHNRPASNKAFDLFCIKKKRYDLQYYFYKKSQHTA